jgi:transcriptional regulator with XRE-family HTH domain
MLKIGERIRELRKGKKITLIELSARTGVAQATLSRIETGTMIGTVESHQKIAEALGTTLSELYAGVDSRLQEIQLSKSPERKIEKRAKASVEVLTGTALKKKMLPILVRLEPGGELALEKEEPGVEKFIYVLKGECEVSIEKNAYRLRKEESIYFDAALSHALANTSVKNPAEAFCVTSPPRI